MEFSQVDMTEDKKLTLRIRYVGEKTIDFTVGRVYTAKKLKREAYDNDSFSIVDDDGGPYVYSGKFIRSDFKLIEVV